MSGPEIRAALDTTVVMRLLVGQPPELAAVARAYLAETEKRKTRVYVSNLVVLEAYFACQHHYGMPKAAVLSGLNTLLKIPTFAVSPQVLRLLGMADMDKAKPGFLDRLIHAEAEAAGLPLVTFEKAAVRLPGVRVLGR